MIQLLLRNLVEVVKNGEVRAGNQKAACLGGVMV